MTKQAADFKRKTVGFGLSSGYSRRRVATDSGLGSAKLGNWVRYIA